MNAPGFRPQMIKMWKPAELQEFRCAIANIQKGDRCLCNNKVAFLFPCQHEICADGFTFPVPLVDQRWLKQSGLFVSHDIGDGKSSRDNFDNNAMDRGCEGNNEPTPTQELPPENEILTQNSRATTSTR